MYSLQSNDGMEGDGTEEGPIQEFALTEDAATVGDHKLPHTIEGHT